MNPEPGRAGFWTQLGTTVRGTLDAVGAAALGRRRRRTRGSEPLAPDDPYARYLEWLSTRES